MLNQLYNLFKTIKTGSGFWNPLILVLIIILVFLILYVIRSYGKKDYKKETEQTKVFLSGNIELDNENVHVKASNMYWGFLESFKWLYKWLKKMHSGNTSDYVLWFVIVIGILFVVVTTVK
jgi:uncharacterized ion transporter superfamily protein YfcC